MTQLITAIAILCGNPGYMRLGETSVLDCQKYYLNCLANKGGLQDKDAETHLILCVMNKQDLGGSK